MAFEHNDIATKSGLRAGLGETSMGFEHNDIVTTDVMNAAIAAGGGGGGDLEEISTTMNEGTITLNASYSDVVAMIADGKIPYFQPSAEEQSTVNLYNAKYICTVYGSGYGSWWAQFCSICSEVNESFNIQMEFAASDSASNLVNS